MKRCIFILLALLCGCGGSTNAIVADASAPSEAASAGSADAPQVDVETYQLDNGMTVLLSRDDRLPVVAVEVRYMVGSCHEREGRSGFAHLFEHLMFQGSANYNDEYFKPLTPIGASVNGTTSSDRTNYYERVPREYLELALWLESDRMENLLPALTQAKLDNQREVVKNERRQSYEDRPYGMVWLRLFENLYPQGHPYDHTPIGSHEDLTAATLDDVKDFFKEYYVPANAVLTIVGDFETEKTKALVNRYFGGIDAGTRTPWPTVQAPTLEKSVHLTETDEVKLPRIYLAWHSPALLKAGDADLDILAGVLSTGKTSRLYKPLVYDQKVAKDVAAFQVSMALGSFFVVQATAAPGTSLETLSGALEVALENALATPPTDEEMNRVLNGWKKSFYGRSESVLSRAQLLSTYYHIAGDADYLGKDLARYTQLTPEDIKGAVDTYLKAPRLRIDILPVPEKKTDEAPEGGE